MRAEPLPVLWDQAGVKVCFDGTVQGQKFRAVHAVRNAGAQVHQTYYFQKKPGMPQV
ncbi:hypothetical protein GCM10023149_28600 [Mucilaginibacter gynuensis]|uniref:Uncharacterized protein n=1 Tax=Mucilaginibacter gynuensis TaxID=1302236 RepID=A0ABP8GKZ6_9SPHI